MRELSLASVGPLRTTGETGSGKRRGSWGQKQGSCHHRSTGASPVAAKGGQEDTSASLGTPRGKHGRELSVASRQGRLRCVPAGWGLGDVLDARPALPIVAFLPNGGWVLLFRRAGREGSRMEGVLPERGGGPSGSAHACRAALAFQSCHPERNEGPIGGADPNPSSKRK